jgi:hypothetical protein
MAFRALADKGKTQIRSWPEDVVATLKRESEAAITRLSQSSEFAGRVHASFAPFLANATALGRTSERLAYQMRG